MEYKEYIVRVYDNRTEWRNKEGQLHKIGGPAIEYNNGNKKYFQNNLYHRLNGPAIEYANGDKFWYQNDKCHRLDGPACEWSNEKKAWYIEGIEYTEEEFLKKTSPVKEYTVAQICELLGYEVKIVKE